MITDNKFEKSNMKRKRIMFVVNDTFKYQIKVQQEAANDSIHLLLLRYNKLVLVFPWCVIVTC